FLYGVALLYGATGSTKLPLVAEFLAGGGSESDALLLGGMALLLVGLFFKVAAVPFHAWTPDVYEGSPPVAVAYMSAGVKAAGFAALLRVFNAALGANAADWQPIVYAIAALTVLAGATLAVVQSDVRRLLAYSSISHAGFILVGVQAATDQGLAGSLFYLGVYAFLALGSFAVVTIIGYGADGRQSLDAYDGLAKRSPALAAAFAVLLLAQAGVPFTTGFWAKLEVIGASVEARSYWLAAMAMLGAVVAAFLYLRIVVRMYLTAPASTARPPVSRSAGFVVAVCAAVTVVFGVLPGPLVELTNDATIHLGGG
ncbi:MAG: NADH-quinone oxidoreductase subunit N, partial [bacterium]|nr:NADH-quinone oxidoreductase subunit N [bacterium]